LAAARKGYSMYKQKHPNTNQNDKKSASRMEMGHFRSENS